MKSGNFNNMAGQQLAIRLLPYRVGKRIFGFIFSRKIIQRAKYKQKWRLFSRFTAICPSKEPNREFAKGLNRQFFRVWAIAAFSKMSDHDMQALLRFHGLEAFRQLADDGKGVLLLNCNVGMGRLLPTILARQNIDNLLLEGGFLTKVTNTEDVQSTQRLGKGSNFLLRQVFEANKALKNGGVVHTTGDGGEGSRFKEVAFLGHQRGFATTLLEVALKNQSHIVPVAVLEADDGGLDVRFFPELKAPLDESPDIDTVLAEYVGVLEGLWCDYPGQVAFGHIRNLLNSEAYHS